VEKGTPSFRYLESEKARLNGVHRERAAEVVKLVGKVCNAWLWIPAEDGVGGREGTVWKVYSGKAARPRVLLIRCCIARARKKEKKDIHGGSFLRRELAEKLQSARMEDRGCV